MPYLKKSVVHLCAKIWCLKTFAILSHFDFYSNLQINGHHLTPTVPKNLNTFTDNAI